MIQKDEIADTCKVEKNIYITHGLLRLVNSAVVQVNASIRFGDGQQHGPGTETGFKTTRLLAFDPMGAQVLTMSKFVIFGERQVRV